MILAYIAIQNFKISCAYIQNSNYNAIQTNNIHVQPPISFKRFLLRYRICNIRLRFHKLHKRTWQPPCTESPHTFGTPTQLFIIHQCVLYTTICHQSNCACSAHVTVYTIKTTDPLRRAPSADEVTRDFLLCF